MPSLESSVAHHWIVLGWIGAVSAFVVMNTGEQAWPSALLDIPYRVYRLIHIVSGMLFSGSIVTTTVLEWTVVDEVQLQKNNSQSIAEFWFEQPSAVERSLVLPALGGLLVSGVGQCFLSYGGGIDYAPFHVKTALLSLALFGIWWAWTDRTTQGPALQAAKELHQPNEGEIVSSLPAVWFERRFSNIVSCLFLMIIYGIMVLKPTFR
jgi:hypothetical protein